MFNLAKLFEWCILRNSQHCSTASIDNFGSYTTNQVNIFLILSSSFVR